MTFTVQLPTDPGAFAPRDDERPTGQVESGAGISRRSLLLLTGAGVVSSALPARLAFAGREPDHRLIVLFLRGGADALSLLAPLGDPHYAKARPTIALNGHRALRADRMFGFHPDATGLHDLFRRGQLAPVVAVGAPDPTRSHFEAMERMETCSYQSSPMRTGWLDRYAGAAGLAGTFSSVALGWTMPRSLEGPQPELVVPYLDGFAVRARGSEPAFLAALREVNDGSSGVDAAMRTAMDAATTLKRLRGRPLGAYPNTSLGRSLHDIATMARAGLAVQMATVDVGGWDMHAGLGKGAGVDGGWMGRNLRDLSGSLHAFAADLGSEWSKTTVVVMSEFGRRVAENADGGVDHGHGNTWLVLGGRVRGGKVYGTWPGLSPQALDQGDVAGRTDHRQVLAEVLSSACGASARAVRTALPGAPSGRLGLIR